MKHLIIVSVLFLLACTSKPDAEDAAMMVEQLRYVKAKNGVCYGVTNTLNTAANVNVILTYVPCEKVGL